MMKVKLQLIDIPQNINLLYCIKTLNFLVENNDTKINCNYKLPFFLDYKYISTNKINIYIKLEFLNFISSKMMLYTYVSKFRNIIKGISELYRGTINIQGLGYSVAVTKLKNNMYRLFFRFGFKDTFVYIMPSNIIIENAETAKIKINLICSNLELLKKVQLQIQNLRRPKAFKLQGIYLNDKFPKIKKFVK